MGRSFYANFKPLRGNYIADGGLRTLIVGHYPPNDWGLYDMAGNVAEWTNSAFDPLSYNFTPISGGTYNFYENRLYLSMFFSSVSTE